MKGMAMRLSVIFFIVSILTFLSLVSMGAIDEGTQGDGILGSIMFAFSKLFYLFRFPTHTFLFDYMDGSKFIWGLLINCLFWTIVIHYTIKYLKK
jgi:hypothetical protein